jgi:hypothetical protein
MITKFGFKNFKAWEAFGPVRFAPLTILFGSNSSGKSSVAQFLLMLKQTVESQDRKMVFNIGGSKTTVDLGNFYELVHCHEENRKISFKLAWKLPTLLTLKDAYRRQDYSGTEMGFESEVGVLPGRGSLSPACVTACANALNEITIQGLLVLDSLGLIVKEYQNKLLKKGQRGPGDEFLLWVFSNQWNPSKCQRIQISKITETPPFFAEFPQSRELLGFDPSDCKFVATANAHPDKPPIVVGIDSDWVNARSALIESGITIYELCPADLTSAQALKSADRSSPTA